MIRRAFPAAIVAAALAQGCANSLAPAFDVDAGSDVPTPRDVAIDAPTDVPPARDVPIDRPTDAPPARDISLDTPADVPPDRPPVDASNLCSTDPHPLGPHCASPADCTSPGADAECLIDYPGGYCTIRCADDTTCGPTRICVQGLCRPRCVPTVFQHGSIVMGGDGACGGHGTLCRAVDPADTSRGACLPSCNDPPDPGVCDCVNDFLFCELDIGACAPRFQPPGPTGEVGDPCTVDARGQTQDCRSGICVTSTYAGSLDALPTPTGFVDGYCVSIAPQLGLDQYVANAPIPRGSCPEGSVMILRDPDSAQVGEPQYCLRECHASRACRIGYECYAFPVQGSATPTFTDGACLPIPCADPSYDAVPNRGCPDSAHCDPAARDGGVCVE